MSLYVTLTQKGKPREVPTLFRLHEKEASPQDYEAFLSQAESKRVPSFEIAFPSSPENEGSFLPFLEALSLHLASKDVSVGILLNDPDFLKRNLKAILSLGVTVPSFGKEEKRGRQKEEPPFEEAILEGAPPNGKPLLHRHESKGKSPRAFHPSMGAPSASLSFVAQDVPYPPLEESFHQRLLKLLNESGKSNAEVYRRGGISRQVFSNILSNPDVIPTKPTVLCLIIGLELSYREAVKLLETAGYALSRSIRSDAIVSKYLKREVFDLMAINVELDEYGCPPLGWHPRDN
ncbi:MAG: hypothetical protein K6E59_01680 [Bacilli bacterium]|nr:hypothetical protein [Bacilli bacterium]